MRKKIAIMGRGTAGVLSAAHFSRWAPNCELELYFDSNIKPQPVGEGAQTNFSLSLKNNLCFMHDDLHKIDGSFKIGVKKIGWGKGKTFTHYFEPPWVSYHFNASALQNYVVDEIKDRVKIFDKNISNELDGLSCFPKEIQSRVNTYTSIYQQICSNFVDKDTKVKLTFDFNKN